jgi:hypothetical protein
VESRFRVRTPGMRNDIITVLAVVKTGGREQTLIRAYGNLNSVLSSTGFAVTSASTYVHLLELDSLANFRASAIPAARSSAEYSQCSPLRVARAEDQCRPLEVSIQ